MSYIFWANDSKWKYMKFWGVKRTLVYLLLRRFYYFKHIVSIIEGWSYKDLRLTEAYWGWLKKHCLLKNCKILSASSTRANILISNGSILMSEYCKTGIREHTLLRKWFVKAFIFKISSMFVFVALVTLNCIFRNINLEKK